MEPMQIARTWISAFTDTDNTVKRLKKEKLAARDGLVSAGIISLLAGIVIFVAVVALIALVPQAAAVAGTAGYAQLFAVFVVLLPLLAMLGVAVFTALLRGVSMLLGGKGGFSRDCGMLGIIVGLYVVAMIPLAIAYVLAFGAGASNAVLAILLIGLGTLFSAGLQGLVQGAILELLADAERLSVSRSGMLWGFSMGIVAFVAMLIGALVTAMFGAAPTVTTP